MVFCNVTQLFLGGKDCSLRISAWIKIKSHCLYNVSCKKNIIIFLTTLVSSYSTFAIKYFQIIV